MGFQVYLKREDLLHGGAHKINNSLGQGLLAKYMGKTKLIAETGAGQHGLATVDGRRPAGHGDEDLHGRHRRRAAERQRPQDEALRRRGRAGRRRDRDAQGRDQRRPAVLDGHT